MRQASRGMYWGRMLVVTPDEPGASEGAEHPTEKHHFVQFGAVRDKKHLPDVGRRIVGLGICDPFR